MAAWIETSKGETPTVWMQQLNTDGSLRSPPRGVGVASSSTWNNVAVDGSGTFYVTYDGRLNTQNNELRLLAISPDNVRDFAISPDDSFASVYPDIAISGTGVAAITWFDAREGNEGVYLAMMPLDDLLAGTPQPASPIRPHRPSAPI